MLREYNLARRAARMRASIYRVRPLVAAVLRESPAARDNDNVLTLRIWQQCGLEVNGDIDQLAAALPHVQTIQRQRAYIQNILGRFLPSPDISAKRRKHAGRQKDGA
jgi:hypothetical protein